MKSEKGALIVPVISVLVAIIAVMAVLTAVFGENKWLAVAFSAAALVCLLAVLLMYRALRRGVDTYLGRLSSKVTSHGAESMNQLIVPMVTLDEAGDIIWHNEAFRNAVLEGGEAHTVNISRIFKGIDPANLATLETVRLKKDKRYYDATVVEDTSGGRSSYIMFLDDVTDECLLCQQIKDTSPAVILIVFDNEDELLKARESERMSVFAQIDSVINEWLSGTSAIYRSNARETSLVVLEEADLQKLMGEKFSVLASARRIVVSGGHNVTLSVGVGHGASSLSECENWAQQALDMALGRGGDQAAIKDENGYTFFGGVSQSAEKSSKVKTRMLAKAMAELISASDRCYVMGHRFSDLDSVGASIGMMAIARSLGVDARVVVDCTSTVAQPLVDAYADNVEDGHSLFVTPQQALENTSEKMLVIVVDTHSSDFLECKELYEMAENSIIIDHHRMLVNRIEDYTFFFHEPFASSASEMVAELAQYINAKAITSAEAEALLSGIMLDTKSFVLKTGVRTFEAATFLRRRGADTVDVKMLFAGSLDNYAEKAKIVANANIYRDCAIAFTEENFADIRVVAAQAADEMLTLQGVSATFVMFESNGAINISARSFGKLNVQLVMEQLGGGGHLTMAGAQLAGSTMKHTYELLCAAIDAVAESEED